MPPVSATRTRPMSAISLDSAVVTLVDHGNGAGFGILVDGQPALPTVMLLPAGQVERYNLIVSGCWTATVSLDEVRRWAPIMARSQQSITGSVNGHANGAAKPAARPRARAGTTTRTTATRASTPRTTTTTAATPRRARAGPATARK